MVMSIAILFMHFTVKSVEDYGTAQFKLEAHECITWMFFVTAVEYFIKSHMFADTYTINLHALHTCLSL